MIEQELVAELSERGYDPIGVEMFITEVKGLGFRFERDSKPDIVDRFVLRYSNEDSSASILDETHDMVSILDTMSGKAVFSGDLDEYKEYAEQEVRRRNRTHWRDADD